MGFRILNWAYLWFAIGVAGAVADERPDARDAARPSATRSLDKLKAEGAKQSKYQQWPALEETDVVTPTTVAPEARLSAFHEAVEPILLRSCLECHGPTTTEGGLRIDTLDPDLLHGDDVDWWLEVLAVLTNREMPPPDAEQLEDQARSEVVDWLSHEIQTASTVRRATAEHSSFRRLTRYETNYALQDILGLPWNFAKDLPPEAHSADGFLNSSEMLHMSVVQLEGFRRIARQALRRATVRGERLPQVQWGISMREAAAREWPEQAKELDKIKEKFKDDPEKQRLELEKLTASFNKPHSQPYYLELSTGRTARAKWAYNGAKYAFAPTTETVSAPNEFDHVAVLPGGRNQSLTVELGNQIPEEGWMRVRVRASRASVQDEYVPSLQLEFGFRASNEGQAVVRVSDVDMPIDASPDSPEMYQWDVPLGEIYPRNAFRTSSPLGGLPSPSEFIRLVNSSVSQAGVGDIRVDYVEVTAPVYDAWPPASHRRIFFESKHSTDESVYASEILAEFMPRAWRRSISADELNQKLELFNVLRGTCDSFEEAVIEVLATVLSSPNFLYVSHNLPGSDDSGRLTGEEVAARLSLLLWCSVPDDRLLELAASGQLQDADVLAAQVERMLADSRSTRFAEHFVHQWLDMQLLDYLALDRGADPQLKEAMQREPIMFFQELLRQDTSVLDFLHADYTMADERLAKHYGLKDVRGNYFRRVPLQDGHQRGGLLTQAGLLAMNSDGHDSHPLKRGVWLLNRLLNDPPPPPPPAVPEIDLADPEIAKLTLKERIEDHRNHAACLSCHAKIDPWGIAFENYDALGRWRTEIDGQPVDASSLLFNDEPLNGMDGLKRYLLINRQDQFVRAMVHKMATYALGRPLAFGEYASVDAITADVRRRGDGLATLVQALIQSELFQSN